MERTPSVTASRNSLSQQVRNFILSKIASGDFSPNDRIVEARIAEELNVSSIPVREAIRELVAMRVLEYVVHKGARVREVSIAETVDALHVKAVLEALAARLAGTKLKAEAGKLHECVKLILDSALRRDYIAYQDHNQRFHRTVLEASGNQILLKLWDSLAFEVRTRFILDHLKSDDPNDLAKEHADILNAIEREDTEKAASLLTTHANRLVEHLKNQMGSNARETS